MKISIDKLMKIHDSKKHDENAKEADYSIGKLTIKDDIVSLSFKQSELMPKVNKHGFYYFTIRFEGKSIFKSDALNFRTNLKHES